MKSAATVVALALGLAFSGVHAQNLRNDIAAGAELYKVCAGCHGFDGQGNALVNAPKLAGLEDWYLRRQLENYLNGIRGASPDYPPGRTMATMARVLTDDDDIADVVDYMATLKPRPVEPSVSGDVAAGEQAYAQCAACHGQNAQGNPALNAPGLAGLPDWYQLAQLQNFKSGLRGTHPEDTYGQQMAPMARQLDEQKMRNILSYINTLR